MPIIVGIDGTGDEVFPSNDRNQRYDDVFANSFVRKLCNEPPGPNKKYYRGPVLLGGGLLEAAREGVNFVLTQRRISPKEPILLTGYSRGAAGVIFIATQLQRRGVDVKALLMFDCVDRTVNEFDASTIPNNVGSVLHVLRSDEGGSRGSFGHAGTIATPPTRYKEAEFTCTHGGMGGTPWTVPMGGTANDFIVEGFPDGKTHVTYAQDAFNSSRIWGYVGPFIREQGFPIPPRPWCAPTGIGMGMYCSAV